MSEEQTNYDNTVNGNEITKAIEQLDQEIEIEVNLNNGNTEKMYYKFENLNYKHIESAKLALIIWDEKHRNPPQNLPSLQQTFHEQAGAMGMAMILYVKDDKGNPIPFDGNINTHRPYKLLDYARGDSYKKLEPLKDFFLSNWGVTSFNFKNQFLNTTQLLMTHQMEGMKEIMRGTIAKKGYTKKQQKEIAELIDTLLTRSLVNTSQMDLSGLSVQGSDTKEKKSTQ